MQNPPSRPVLTYALPEVCSIHFDHQLYRRFARRNVIAELIEIEADHVSAEQKARGKPCSRHHPERIGPSINHVAGETRH